jgi:hypothetical protein
MDTKKFEKESLKEIQDVDVAAYLITLGFKLAHPAGKYSSQYISFLFEKSDALNQACLDFFDRKGKLEDALAYAENIRLLYKTVRGLRLGGDR